MTARRTLKRLIRARMSKTGEAYTTARRHLLRSAGDSLMNNATNLLQQAAAAAERGDLTMLATLLADSPEVLTGRDGDGETLLGLACRAATGGVAIPPVAGTPAQHAAVDAIIAAGADPDAGNQEGWTPLHSAAMAGHVELTRRLLAAGAALDSGLYGSRGGTPLALALFYAKQDAAELIAQPATPNNLRHAAALGRDLSPFVSGTGELTAQASESLDWAAPNWFPEWQRSLSEQEVLDEALTWAARNGQCGSMVTLVELGADVNANPFRGTALLWAIYSDDVQAATWLLDAGADPDLRHDFGGAGHGVSAVAMHLAAQHGGMGCLRLLVERGADRTIVDGSHGGTPQGWAEFGGAGEAAAYLRGLD